MIKIVLLILAIFIATVYFIYLIYSKKRSYVKYALVVLVLLVGIYNIIQQDREDYIHEITLAYNNDKNIICNDINITKKTFNIVTATSVFVGKRKSSYTDYVIPFETCKVAK